MQAFFYNIFPLSSFPEFNHSDQKLYATLSDTELEALTPDLIALYEWFNTDEKGNKQVN